MRRKHNPIVSLAAFLLLAIILVLVCAVSAGCAAETEADETEKTPDRFTIEVATNNGEAHHHTVIITDTETGAQYLYFKSMNSGGLTLLQPGEG